jgi:Domain of unknown function (DUF4136)
MRRFPLIALAMFAALSATGCATMTVGAHVQQGLDLRAYHTFDWGTPDALPASDPRFDRNPFFTDRLLGAVEKGLVGRGLALSTSGTPDLLVHYHATIARQPRVIREDPANSSCTRSDCVIEITRYEAATLVLDIVDARTNTLLWRGWAQGEADDILNNRGRMTKAIDESVARMLRRLPPKL